MISITCTQCQAVLTIDDAFAGGVCRCQHCGTIQTVPSKLKATAPLAPQPYVSPSLQQPKTLYQNQAAARMAGANVATAGNQSSKDLDDLAQAVGASSSSLSGSSLRGAYVAPPAATSAATASKVLTYAPPTRGAKKSPLIPALIGAGVLIVVLIGIIAFMAWSIAPTTPPGTVNSVNSNPGTGTARAVESGPGQNSSPTPSPTATGPSFCGTPISGSRVIYLLDNANSISDDFDAVRAAALESVVSLGSNHKFAVILWNKPSDEDFVFPHDDMGTASTSQADSLRTAIQDIQATGRSLLAPALERAMARNPDAVIIVTAKSNLEAADESALAAAQNHRGTRFYTFTVAGADNEALQKAASASGGVYRHLTSQEIHGTP